MKKTVILLLLIICVFASTIGGAVFCCAQEASGVEELENIVAKMTEIYEIDPENTQTVEYYGCINNGEKLLADDEFRAFVSDELIASFDQYKFYYYQVKTLNKINETFVSATFTIKFENKSFFFYDEQWGSVEEVYNEYKNRVETASVDSNLNAIFEEYYSSIDCLVDREELDSQITAYIEEAVFNMDKAVVSRINISLKVRNLPLINDNEILSYMQNSDTSDYNKWFTEVLANGYSTSNAVNVAVVHSKAIDKLLALPLDSDKSAYEEISNNAIVEIEKIDIEINLQNAYLLEARKQSTIMRLQYFLESEDYTEAEKDVQKEMKRIIDLAFERLEGANTVSEVDRILNETLNALADINVGGNDWVKVLSIGIVITVLFIVAIVIFILKKNKLKLKKRVQNSLHLERVAVEKQIDSVLDEEGKGEN